MFIYANKYFNVLIPFWFDAYYPDTIAVGALCSVFAVNFLKKILAISAGI